MQTKLTFFLNHGTLNDDKSSRNDRAKKSFSDYYVSEPKKSPKKASPKNQMSKLAKKRLLNFKTMEYLEKSTKYNTAKVKVFTEFMYR